MMRPNHNDQINDEVSAMTEFYKGETPSDIPMMPDEIKYEDYRESLSLPDMLQWCFTNWIRL